MKLEWDLVITSTIFNCAFLGNVGECLLGKQDKIQSSSWNGPVAGYQECSMH